MPTTFLADGRTIHRQIAAQAARTPERVALITDRERLTYAELMARADRLARLLRGRGVDLEQTVGVCLERSADLLVSLLAVLEAGGTYLPLDPNYPRERVAFMLQDALSRWVITRRALDPLFAEGHGRSAEKLYLEELEPELAAQPPGPPEDHAQADALAYLIYTSGSTGRPKGVSISHANAVSFFAWAELLFPLAELRGVFAATSVCFDLSIFELFFPLTVGGTVILGRDALHLRDHPARDLVTLVNTVPSAITELARMGAIPPGVVTVNLAGEPLKRALTDQVYAAGQVRKVYNLYGPSEDTTYSTWVLVPRDSAEEPTIGIPIDGSEGYVIGPRGELLSDGEVGELYLGGEGVSRGYLGRPDVTAEKYLPDPWSGRPGARLYRTGDRVRRRPDGELDYLGRFDHQVKIRGFRIELGEIEAALARHSAVEMPLALVREDQPGDKTVVAYFQPRGQAPTPAELRDLLLESLPHYMVPAAFVALDKMPLTPNGKIDRNVLQKIPPEAGHLPAAAEEVLAPRTELERRLATLFAEALRLPEVGIRHSFFELGGHSLLAARILARLGEELGVELGQRQLFETPTVEALAAHLEGRQGDAPKAPIPRLDRAGVLPISAAQRGLWFLDKLVPGSPRYNVPVGAWLHGPLDAEALRRALELVVGRHEALRTRIVDQGGRPVLLIDPAWQAPEVEDLRGLPDADAAARRIADEEAAKPFALAVDRLLRCRLLRVADQRHLLLTVQHHIVTDGISQEIFFRELGAAYRGDSLSSGHGHSLSSGHSHSLSPVPLQMVDAVAYANSRVEPERERELLAFWRRFLEGGERFDLPIDRPRSPQPLFRGARTIRRFDPALTAGLRQLARRHDATLFMVTAAGLCAWMARLTGRRDITFGTPFAGRDRTELEPVLGFLINTLPIRWQAEGHPTFDDMVRQLRAAVLDVFSHQDLAFDRLVDALRPERELNRNPFYDVTFQVRDGYFGEDLLEGLRAEWLPLHNGTCKIDIDFALVHDGDTLRAEIDYDRDLFDDASMAALLESWEQTLVSAVAHPEKRLGELDLLPPGQHEAIAAWNATGNDAPLGRSLAELFLAAAARHPARPALSYGDVSLDYRELERRSRQLAHRLRDAGVRPGDFVAVALERSVELIVAMVAAVRAGAAYVPLDTSYPGERLAFMLDDTGAPVLIQAEDAPAVVPLDAFLARGGRVVSPRPEAGEPPPLERLGGPELPAYVIYTSGSTGKPKGVTIRQRSIVRLTFGGRFYEFGPDDRVAQVSNASFDAATYEIWGAFLHGGHLVGVDRETLLSAPAFRAFLARERITTLFMTAALFQQFMPREPGLFAGVRTLLVGGDRCDPTAMRLALGHDGPQRLVNGYGPTETTTFAAWYHVREVPADATSIPIGYPLGNTDLYVVDAWGGQAPIGGLGELFIGGEGLALGYHARPELTARAFVPHPWAKAPGERLYRTGDLARRLPGGAIDCLGRIDQQVKVRGFRIELGEIETQLSRHPDVAERVVVVQPDGQGGKRLVGYVAPRPGARLSGEDLHSFLGRSLPAHLVPTAWVLLDALPLTANGKVDRRALPDYQAGAEGGGSLRAAHDGRPRTPFERKVHEVFCEVLGAPALDIDSHFFSLGGHSLSGVLLVSRLRALFRIELPLAAIYQSGTIAGMTATIEEALLRQLVEPDAAEVRLERPTIPRREPGTPVPALPSQAALYALSRLEQSVSYNLPMTVELVGALDVDVFRQALDALVRRHEALRSHFRADGTALLLVAEPPGPLPLPLDDLRGRAETDREAAVDAILAAEAALTFDLERGPLARARLLRLGEEHHVFSLVMHHSVTDGTSNGILLRELGLLYPALLRGETPVLPEVLQLGDVALWQSGRHDEKRDDAEAAWWRERLQGVPPLELPLDRPRPPLQSSRGRIHRSFMPPSLVASARAYARGGGHSLFNVLLAAFYGWLGRLAQRRDVVVGTPFAGRERDELAAVMGYFVRLLPLRVSWRADADFAALVADTAATLEEVQEHQELPFDRIVAAAEPRRDPSRHPIFQVLFQLAELELEAAIPGFHTGARRSHSGTAKFDLMVALAAEGESLEIEWEYCLDLFEAGTVARWAEGYLAFLDAALRAPSRPIARLPMLAPADRELLAALDVPALPVPAGERLTDAFWRQAAAQPDAPALRVLGDTLSYGEVAGRVAALATRLQAAGVGPEVLVAICLERRAELIVALLAVVAAGGAYVPLDPTYPRERLAGTLEDCRARLLLAQRALEPLLPAERPETWWLDEWPAEAPRTLAAPPHSEARPDNLAYLIYTSGSTGRPKGVAISHRNALAMVAWSLHAFRRDQLAATLASTSICFDLSIFEIFVPLSSGATVVLADNALALPRLPAKETVTLINTVPSAMRELARIGGLPAALQVVNLAGEALPGELVDQLYQAGVPEVRNLYGPSEDTTYSTWSLTAEAEPPAIGLPLAGSHAYLLDAGLEPLPAGAIGEIWLGGAGISRGYLGRPGLTAERYLPDPWAREAGARMYRTGDLGRLADGQLYYLGRVDRQVKIRGFRIEIGEVEAALAAHPAVRERVVVASPDAAGQPRLVAYLVCEGPPPPISELRALLGRTLPEFMIPSFFVPLDALPRTPNGKVDAKRLPSPDLDQLAGDTPPADALEALVAEVWSQVLGVAHVGRESTFFDLGGHSLHGTRLVATLGEQLGLDLPVLALFQAPQLAAFTQDLRHRLAATDEGRALLAELAELDTMTDEERAGLLVG